MKNYLIIALVCTGLGFAGGWISKPDSTPTTQVASTDSTDKKTSRTITKSQSDTSSSKDHKPRLSTQVFTTGKDSEGMNPETQNAMNNFSKMMKDQQRAKFEARIAVLVDKLKLTPAQEAKLRAQMEKHLESMGDIWSPDGKSTPPNPMDIASILSGDGMDDTLAEILSPEQEEEYDALKKRERENKVEASALKNLAKLSFLDMSQEQKDAAYDILYSQAEESADKKSPGAAMMSIVSSGMGIELDTDALGLSGIADAQFEGKLDSAAPGDIMTRMKEVQARKVDEKIEALRPVLDEKQLEQYRNHLESKNSGIFQGMMNFNTQAEETESK